MAATTQLAIVTPGAVKFEGTVEIVVAPGAAGDLAALASHAPLLTTLRPGIVRATVHDAAGTHRIAYAVNGGFMQILPSKVRVLTDAALAAGEVDVRAARAELERAETAGGDDDRARREAVAWANARLEVAQAAPQVHGS